MTIELKLENNEEVLLFPIRKSELGDKDAIYTLIDNTNNNWMLLQLRNNSFVVIEKDNRIVESEIDLKIKLDRLVLEVIEAEQSGTDNTESNITEDINPYDPEKIKIHSKAFNLRLIADMINDKDIDLSPDFQRNYVWDSHQKSRLIESILLRIPLPMFYFSEDEEGRITVVDGLQRLTTIKEFMENKFPLKGLEYLKLSCEGKYYSETNKDGTPNGKKAIESKYFRWFNQTQFSVNVIDPSSPPKVKYDIFRRINTGGKALNNQEIRNCLATPILRSLLKEMTSSIEFKSATDNGIKPTRMDDQEVALRFIMFSIYKNGYGLQHYNGYMDASLDDITEDLGKLTIAEKEVWVSKFKKAMMNAEYLFGSKYAFRKVRQNDLLPNAYKQLINKALFVCWSVLLAEFDPILIKANNSEGSLIPHLAERIEKDSTLFGYLSYGTNGRANLQYVFQEAEKLINQHLK